MHHFKRNIGDYYKKTSGLTMIEHGAYTRLMDACYDRERFPTLAEAIEWSWARNEAEISAVEFVLARFFILEDDIYTQPRIAQEIEHFHENATTNQRIAREREAKRRETRNKKKHEANTDRARSVNEAPPNHKPLTINQEPLKDSCTEPQETGAPSPRKKVKKLKVVIATIPTNKFNTQGELFQITDIMVNEWQDTFEGLDVLFQIKKAKQWCIDNPTKRKTHNGMRRFIGSWLGRENDKGGSRLPATTSATATRDRSLLEDLSDTSWAD